MVLQNHTHLTFKSDSETESDDLNRYNIIASRSKGKEKSIIEKCDYNKSYKKRKMVDGESSRTVQESIEESELQDSSTILIAADAVLNRAEKYQKIMKRIKVPAIRGDSTFRFITWQGLGRSMNQIYRQPLHYLTCVMLKQWDEARVGTADELEAMQDIMDVKKAESILWQIEEIHRRTTSDYHLAKLWIDDPSYRLFVDPILDIGVHE